MEGLDEFPEDNGFIFDQGDIPPTSTPMALENYIKVKHHGRNGRKAKQPQKQPDSKYEPILQENIGSKIDNVKNSRNCYNNNNTIPHGSQAKRMPASATNTILKPAIFDLPPNISNSDGIIRHANHSNGYASYFQWRSQKAKWQYIGTLTPEDAAKANTMIATKTAARAKPTDEDVDWINEASDDAEMGRLRTAQSYDRQTLTPVTRQVLDYFERPTLKNTASAGGAPGSFPEDTSPGLAEAPTFNFSRDYHEQSNRHEALHRSNRVQGYFEDDDDQRNTTLEEDLPHSILRGPTDRVQRQIAFQQRQRLSAISKLKNATEAKTVEQASLVSNNSRAYPPAPISQRNGVIGDNPRRTVCRDPYSLNEPMSMDSSTLAHYWGRVNGSSGHQQASIGPSVNPEQAPFGVVGYSGKSRLTDDEVREATPLDKKYRYTECFPDRKAVDPCQQLVCPDQGYTPLKWPTPEERTERFLRSGSHARSLQVDRAERMLAARRQSNDEAARDVLTAFLPLHDTLQTYIEASRIRLVHAHDHSLDYFLSRYVTPPNWCVSRPIPIKPPPGLGNPNMLQASSRGGDFLTKSSASEFNESFFDEGGWENIPQRLGRDPRYTQVAPIRPSTTMAPTAKSSHPTRFPPSAPMQGHHVAGPPVENAGLAPYNYPGQKRYRYGPRDLYGWNVAPVGHRSPNPPESNQPSVSGPIPKMGRFTSEW
ncbi:MAG: hypothetical protein M1831_004525 [Alyxoria varia]|nr:MAG: hypothetical protein M1831_004525 [Alyxoria varia]